MNHIQQHPRHRRSIGPKLAAVAVAVLALVGVTSEAALAKGGTEAEAPAAPVACSPVSSLGYKGDARAGETGIATITVTYGVKPCDKRPVRVDARVRLNAAPATEVYANADAPLSGKFTVAGVRVNTSYIATISVFEAQAGPLVGSKSTFPAATTKGV